MTAAHRTLMGQKLDPGRLESLRAGPVLRTLAGARARIAAMPLGDIMLLLAHFDCEIDSLHRRLWTGQRKRPGGSRSRPGRTQRKGNRT